MLFSIEFQCHSHLNSLKIVCCHTSRISCQNCSVHNIMAPHSSYKKQVKFVKSRSPVPRKKITNPADSYANIVLHYLSKLKRVFQSPITYHKDVSRDRASYDTVSKPILKNAGEGIISRSGSEAESRQKVYHIVNEAIQFGRANNIVEKVGSYFLVKSPVQQHVSRRRPTPGPDYIRCASCKNLAKFSKRCTITHGRTSLKRRKGSSSNTSVVNYCPKCYCKIRSNRRA